MNKGFYPGANGLLLPTGVASLSGSIAAGTNGSNFSGDIAILGSSAPPVFAQFIPVSTYPPGLILTPTYVGFGRYVVRAGGLAGTAGSYIGTTTITLADGQVLTSAQTVTIAAQDSLWATMQFALHGNGANNGTTFTDAKGTYAWTAFGSGAITSTTQSKFNGSSIFCTAAAGIETTTAFAGQASNQFCLDFWMFIDNSQSGDGEVFVQRGAGSGTNFIILRWVSATGKLRFVMNNGSNVIDTSSTQTIAKNGWHYVRVQRRTITGTLTMEQSVDGVYGTSGTDTGVAFTSPGCAAGFGISDVGNSAGGVKAYFAEMRFATGVRDTGSNFTPPTAAFPEG